MTIKLTFDSLFFYFLLKNYNPIRCYLMITTLKDSDSPVASVTKSLTLFFIPFI